jgi:adenylate kinase
MQGHHHVVLLLGAPGAGKGTQARFLGVTLGTPHVASGDLLRDHRRRGTELGRAAQAYMDRGELVPDQLVIDMVVERLQRSDAVRGALLDGFPRTRAQAEALDRRLQQQGGTVRAAIYLEVPKPTLVERLAGRWVCGACGDSFHERFSPPAVEGVCDACQGELYQRPDDQQEVVEKRVEVYLRETMPVIEHYGTQGLLHRVDGDRSIESVRAGLCAALGGAVQGLRRHRWHLFIDHEPVADDSLGHWLGRTLCGKYIERDSPRQLGTAESFEATPCRQCARALRHHQIDEIETPSVNGVTNGTTSLHELSPPPSTLAS